MGNKRFETLNSKLLTLLRFPHDSKYLRHQSRNDKYRGDGDAGSAVHIAVVELCRIAVLTAGHQKEAQRHDGKSCQHPHIIFFSEQVVRRLCLFLFVCHS